MGMETEADDYLDKPVEPEVLVKRIEALLAK
jgi:DNA-binding response OmpR family regulator